MACTSNNDIQSKILIVADRLENCVGVGPQTCMLIKENPEDEWTYFYDQIEGFEYEEGYTYELLVDIIPIENPAADASSLRYELKNVISKTPSVDQSDLLKEWTVIKMKGLDNLSSSPTLLFQEDALTIAGFAGCNNYFSSFILSNNTLSFENTGSTRKMCPDMTVETVFLNLLPKVARYEIVKKELYLYDQKDELLITAFSN